MAKTTWRASVLVIKSREHVPELLLPPRLQQLWDFVAFHRLPNSSSSQRPITARHVAAGPPFFCFKNELDLRAVVQVIRQPERDPTSPTPQERPFTVPHSDDCHFPPLWRSAGARPPRRCAVRTAAIPVEPGLNRPGSRAEPSQAAHPSAPAEPRAQLPSSPRTLRLLPPPGPARIPAFPAPASTPSLPSSPQSHQ